MQEAGETHKRIYKVCNLDPAAEVFKYKCDIGESDTNYLTFLYRYQRFDLTRWCVRRAEVWS